MNATTRTDRLNWVFRAFFGAWLSATLLQYGPQGEAWGPGVAFSLVLVAALAGVRPLLLIAVAGSYSLGYFSGNLFDPMGTWATRTAVVAVGSVSLGLSLWLLGPLTWRQALVQALVGTALGFPFFGILDHVGEHGLAMGLTDYPWLAALVVWQMPMAFLLRSQWPKD